MKYLLPALPYTYNSLEPYIDAKTMEIHHGKHHQAYITNLNTVLEQYPEYADEKLETLLRKLETLKFRQEKDKNMFKNNAGGHINHSLFWTLMRKGKKLDQKLIGDIKKQWGSLDEFKKIFSQTALSQFGSGWAWLVADNKGKLVVYSLPNQDSPFLRGHTPLIGLDVWEHAYYLKYQNRRMEYIENWWNVLKLI